MQSSLYKLIM